MNFNEFVPLDVELFNNRKIKQLRKMPEGNSMVAFWIQLLCLAGSTQDNGEIYLALDRPYSIKELAIEVEFSEDFIEKTLKIFEEFQMISRENSKICLKNWNFYKSISELE